MNNIAIVEFISKITSAGDVNVELGFIPDFVILISGHDTTNPDIYLWGNVSGFAGWVVEKILKLTGSTGVVTVVTTTSQTMIAYSGNEVIAAAQTTDSSPKHVDRAGVAAAAGHLTAPGIQVAAEIQTAGKRNMLLAFRNDR